MDCQTQVKGTQKKHLKYFLSNRSSNPDLAIKSFS